MEMIAEINEDAYAKVLDEFPPHPIRYDEGNALATAMLMRLVSDPDQTIEKKAVAEILITLIEAYEKRYVSEAASPLDTLLELMAANDLKQKDVVPFIGSRGVTSEVLHGRRAISKAMAHKLAARFNVPHTMFL
jgi:HTH-type transcriptional regulator/antitoxin HigA